MSRLFERKKDSNGSYDIIGGNGNQGDYYDDPYAIQHLSFCPLGRVLAAVCQSFFVPVFTFSTRDNTIETAVS